MSVPRCLNPSCELNGFELPASARLCPMCKQPATAMGIQGGAPVEFSAQAAPPTGGRHPTPGGSAFVSSRHRPPLRLIHTSGREFLVSDDEVSIVRTVMPPPGNVINLHSLPEASIVSKRHAVIRWSSECNAYLLLDLGSTNGTFVNRRRLAPGEPAALHHGDQVRLGDTHLFEFSVQVL